MSRIRQQEILATSNKDINTRNKNIIRESRHRRDVDRRQQNLELEADITCKQKEVWQAE